MSTSTFYKKRAGTTYPLVERLTKAGYLIQTEDAGPRGERAVEITDKGLAEVRNWLTDAVEQGEAAHTVDFLRLRAFYLGAIESGARAKFIDAAIMQMRSHEAACVKTIAKYVEMGDEFSALATEGVLYETRARLEWLTKTRDRFVKLPQGKPPKR